VERQRNFAASRRTQHNAKQWQTHNQKPKLKLHWPHSRGEQLALPAGKKPGRWFKAVRSEPQCQHQFMKQHQDQAPTNQWKKPPTDSPPAKRYLLSLTLVSGV